ncbi:uncharacterized protein L969DRAFT_491835 [Mixia osmundae IAM 14324]|uniref:Uncharacterized protein n=1 Tax=Mixia osmundae (strain CBS 9802 / IAM 14324 / JCM 22182 / KY 12970) TaxID=764103 RepID=G7E127_MIXOS|nr:uncharacterized protein L969DRAFT_491835 [Mixia osmundae IAM 14324]KEI38827.1 hypothetical protein L969DRAFT_491835 [Mixia osmundae IAM 14324]GAA96537.1 hypothetical protein E5Q_03205 [Mixia osmundae IAM 14324]
MLDIAKLALLCLSFAPLALSVALSWPLPLEEATMIYRLQLRYYAACHHQVNFAVADEEPAPSAISFILVRMKGSADIITTWTQKNGVDVSRSDEDLQQREIRRIIRLTIVRAPTSGPESLKRCCKVTFQYNFEAWVVRQYTLPRYQSAVLTCSVSNEGCTQAMLDPFKVVPDMPTDCPFFTIERKDVSPPQSHLPVLCKGSSCNA